MNGSELKAAFRGGQRVYGTMIISSSPKWVPVVSMLGVDFVFIDTEHIAIDREKLSWMCLTYGALGIAPIVRIPEPDPYLACMALDGGAAGILAPYLETVEQVRQLRGAVKLRPLKGQKLRDVLEGSVQLNPTEAAYLKNYNRQNLLVLNIESQAGIDALDEMLAVPDVDAVFIGPHDLSINLGVPEQYSHPAFDQAVRTIIQKTRAAGAGVGNHFSWGLEAEVAWAKAGMNIILHSTDLAVFGQQIGKDFRTIREALGDPARA